MSCGCFCSSKVKVYNPREATLDYLYSKVTKREKGGKYQSKKSINVNYQDEYGRTCLHFAATVGDLGMVEDLVACGADPTVKEARGQTALHYAAMHNKSGGVVGALASRPGAHIRDIHRNTPLHLAAMFGNSCAVRELLQSNVELDAKSRNGQGMNPLEIACLNGHTSVACLLLQIEELVELGAVSDRHDKTRTTPLHLAARKGHADTCLMLLKQGYNVNRESTSGTALHEAVLHGRLEVTTLLCEHGADTTIRNVHGQTPMDVAQKLSAAHSADKLAAIISHYHEQEAMVAQALEDCEPTQPTDLQIWRGELVHIISKNQDGRWNVYVTRGQSQRAGYIPWYKLELLSAHCKPVPYMRASSQMLSERDVSQSGSLPSLNSEHPPGNERPHAVAGSATTERTARILADPNSVLCYEDSQARLYEWLNGLQLAQYLTVLLDAGYDSPALLSRITPYDMDVLEMREDEDRQVLLKACRNTTPERYVLASTPDSLEDWLSALGISCYYSLFVSSGFLYLGDVVGLTEEALERMGITKSGHVTKLVVALESLREWTEDHPLPPRPVVDKPRKPARSLSKNSSVLSSTVEEDGPICSSYWEATPILPEDVTSTNPFDDEASDEELEREITASLDRVPEELVDGGEGDDPPDHLLLSATSLLPLASPPLSPGETMWASEEVFPSEHLIKRGSSEHLDLTSPPPKLLDLDSSMDRDQETVSSHGSSNRDQLEHFVPSKPVRLSRVAPREVEEEEEEEERPSSSRDTPAGRSKDEVDLLREASGNTSPPSPKAYYETDIILQSSTGDGSSSVLTEAVTAVSLRRPPLRSNQDQDLCSSCKLDPDLQQHKKIFLAKLEKRMSSNSDAMKNINWESMSPEVAAVVKSVYADDSNDIPATLPKKKVPPPVAPKPKLGMRKASTLGRTSTSSVASSENTDITNTLLHTPGKEPAKVTEEQVKSAPVPEPQAEPTKAEEPAEPVKETSTPSSEKKNTSVFDDLENMFDEFSKEMDSFMT